MTVKTSDLKDKNSGASVTTVRRQTYVFGIAGLAVLAAVIFIVISSQSQLTVGTVDYAALTKERLADGGFVLGDPNAPITIVEVADFMCPHCQSYKPTMEQFISQYVVTGQARFEYRMMRTQSNTSEFAAKLAECADTLEPGAFWRAHDVLFALAAERRFTLEDGGRAFASRMGMDYGDLLNCTSDADQYETDEALARRAGVTGTPSIMVRYGDAAPTLIGGAELNAQRLGDLVLGAN